MKELLNAILDFSPFILLALVVFINFWRGRKAKKLIVPHFNNKQGELASQDLMSQSSGVAMHDGSISPISHWNIHNRDKF